MPALIANYKIWPAFQLINFNFVPANYRSLGTNIVSLGWNTYLSALNQQVIEKNKSKSLLLEAVEPIKKAKKELKKK